MSAILIIDYVISSAILYLFILCIISYYFSYMPHITEMIAIGHFLTDAIEPLNSHCRHYCCIRHAIDDAILISAIAAIFSHYGIIAIVYYCISDYCQPS